MLAVVFLLPRGILILGLALFLLPYTYPWLRIVYSGLGYYDSWVGLVSDSLH